MAKTPLRPQNGRPTAADPLLVDLALQGGGSHGAFSWGVIDRMLEEENFRLEGISGTSAGAMNAAVLAYGLCVGGRPGARAALEAFWKKVADGARFSPFQRSPLDVLLGRWDLDYSPMYLAAEMMSRLVSPYDLPAGGNPLAGILADSIDFDRLAAAPIKLFITATNVRTGRGRVFTNKDISADVLMASACLPTMFQAVEIEGEHYWDGGYSGNPTITPLIQHCQSRDTMLVQINPVQRDTIPTSARDIVNRLNEVSFNAVLLKELRMIALMRQMATSAHPSPDCETARWAGMRIHRIGSTAVDALGSSSKLNAEWGFLTMLRDEGRKSAEAFLAAHHDDIGVRSTLDIDALLDEG
jgi:NTE family protein